jgi:protein-tyrosine phosphatase
VKEVLVFWHRRKRARLHWVTNDIAFARQPAAGDWPLLRDEGVRCVVDLRVEAPDNAAEVQQHQLCYLRVPIAEGEAASQDDLRQLTGWIDEHLSEHGPVLIHCREGRGRSPMVALASLVRLGIPLAEGYQLVKRANPAVALNNSQEAALMRFAQDQPKVREGGT